MKFKKKWITFAVLVACLVSARYLFLHYPGLVFSYDRFVYYPLQSFRMMLLGFIPFSCGDVWYILMGLDLLVALIRIGYFITKFSVFKVPLAGYVLTLVNTVLLVCLFFVMGWGADYYKPSLKQYWQLPSYFIRDTGTIAAFDKMLVGLLNSYAPHYHTLSFKEMNERSKACYRTYTDSKLRAWGLDVKPTLFGYMMERIGIDGYYNPFTGEGQINGRVPAFMQPFIICHEMAHQAGIAAEDDANLMAYALGTMTDDSSFRYSSYLNIWLYANNRLYRRDSALALKYQAQLNPLTAAHIDTLEQISKKYHNEAAKYTNEIYDSYLKMQDQEMGIRSYGNVASTAWLLEAKRRNEGMLQIRIP